jgi:hypothetical protein
MNVKRELREAMLRAALSRRAALSELSAQEIHAIARFAAEANDALAFLRQMAELAKGLDAAVKPEAILDFLTDNNLMLVEMPNGKEITESSRSEPAGAANA